MQTNELQNNEALESHKVSEGLAWGWEPVAEGRWLRLAVSAVWLGASLASIASTLLAWRSDDSIAAFTTTNSVAPILRGGVIKCIATGIALPCLVACLLWFSRPRHREQLLSAFDTGARLACPGLLAWLLPPLLERSVWDDRLLTMLLTLGIFSVCLERALRVAFGAISRAWREAGSLLTRALPVWLARFGPLTCVVAAAIAYASYTGYHSVLQHHRLNTSAYDLAIYDNLMANGVRGDFFQSSVLFGPKGGNSLASHASLVLVFFLPIYYLYQHAETLLIIQSLLMGGAAITLYLFAATQLPRVPAALVSILYLLYAPLHGANFYDFHWLTSSSILQFLLYFSIARRRHALLLITALLLFSIREDIPLGIGLLGAGLIVSRTRAREGAMLIGLALPFFVLIKFVVMPWAGTWWFADLYKGLMVPGERGYGSVVKTIVTNPLYVFHSLLDTKKLVYWLHLAAPLAFLAYRRWGLALVASSGALMTLLTTDYAPTVSISFHYTALWIPYLFGATVVTLGQLEQRGKWWRASALTSLSAALLLHSYHFGAILHPNGFRGGFGTIPFRPLSAEESSRYQAMRELVAMIPKEASVAGTEEALPHASNRPLAYPIRMWTGHADYLLVATRTLGLGSTRRAIRQAVSEDGYGLIAQKAKLYLFKRDHKSDKTARALTELGI